MGAQGSSGLSAGLALAGAVLSVPSLARAGGDHTPPRFLDGERVNVQVAENTRPAQAIHTAHATDDGQLSGYSIDGGADSALFVIEPDSGALHFKTAPDFERPLSSDGSNFYTVVVRAQDSAGNRAWQTVRVEVTDVDENPPTLAGGPAVAVTVPENSTAVFYTVVATDASGPVRLGLVPGDDAALFTLEATGGLRWGRPADFEAPASVAGGNTYLLGLLAEDAVGNRALQALTVQVTDVDDSPPRLVEASTNSAGTQIVLSFDEALAPATPEISAFAVWVDGIPRAPATVTVSGPSVVLSLGSALAYGQRVAVRYTCPATDSASTGQPPALRDLAGNLVDSLGRMDVVTRVAEPAPSPSAPPPASSGTTDAPDTTAPVFQISPLVSWVENTPASEVVLDLQATDNGGTADAGVHYSIDGPDAACFQVDAAKGQLRFVVSPDHEAPLDQGRSNHYQLTVVASDASGNRTRQDLAVVVTNEAAPPSGDSGPGSAWALWLEAETAWAEAQGSGHSSHDIEAYNRHSAEILQERDNTSRDGSANGSHPMSQWVDAVMGSDIVSQAQYLAGLRLTGVAPAGASGTLAFRLDPDRTDGLDGLGAQVLHLGANDCDGDGLIDVTASYNNSNGEWQLDFVPGSHALRPARHNTYGSGVHQLVVDTDGNGQRNGEEASRLFLVADGTATSSDTGLVGQNYSVQDVLTGDVFVYYYGDPDGPGTAFWSPLDAGDTPQNSALNPQDKDGDGSDWDYYSSPADAAALPPATATNTALHWVTEVQAQVWTLHMANVGSGTWDVANSLAQDHTLQGSNTSRLPSLQEWLALYAANFGGSDRAHDAHTVGAVEPMSNALQNDASAAENWVGDNRPAGWDEYANEWGGYYWAAAPTPRGHAQMWLGYGQLGESLNPSYCAVVL